MLRNTFWQLEYVVPVGASGSIARVSERIKVSSPSISSAISKLEQEFGLPLFVRLHAQGLSLTQAGRQLPDQARLVLCEAGALTDIAGDLAGTVRGPLAAGFDLICLYGAYRFGSFQLFSAARRICVKAKSEAACRTVHALPEK